MPLYIDTSPLKNYPLYRKVFFGQLISIFGSQITNVALPWQIYALTGSAFDVGAMAMVQLVPLLSMGMIGGAIADSFDRRWVCIISEILLALCNAILILLTLCNSITVGWIYALGACMSALNALHRPAFAALIPQLVPKTVLSRISPLNSFISNFGMIAGPALGGLLISQFGIAWTYAVDLLAYLFAISMLLQLPSLKVSSDFIPVSLKRIREGMAYVKERRDLHGTYIVDIIAMTLAFPNPLFPLLAASIAGADKLGWYYSSIAIGALIATLTSRWTLFKKHHGQMITFSASLWGLCIVLFGLSLNFFYLSLFFLMAAGFFDMVSGIFRSTMWNETIPHDKRGRLASVEMLSYASGPLIGSTLMGWMADVWSASQALMIGGVSCFIICLLGGWSLRAFWQYEAQA